MRMIQSVYWWRVSVGYSSLLHGSLDCLWLRLRPCKGYFTSQPSSSFDQCYILCFSNYSVKNSRKYRSCVLNSSIVVVSKLIKLSIFGLLPELRKAFLQVSVTLYSGLPVISTVAILYLLFTMFQTIVGIIYIGIIGIITLLAPVLFIYFYKYKK